MLHPLEYDPTAVRMAHDAGTYTCACALDEDMRTEDRQTRRQRSCSIPKYKIQNTATITIRYESSPDGVPLVGTARHPRHDRRPGRHVHPREAQGQRREGYVVVYVQVARLLGVHLDLQGGVFVLTYVDA